MRFFPRFAKKVPTKKYSSTPKFPPRAYLYIQTSQIEPCCCYLLKTPPSFWDKTMKWEAKLSEIKKKKDNRITCNGVNSKKLWKHSPAVRVPSAFLVLPNFHSCLYLAYRLHVAVHLSSNRSQMTSKCGKNKKVAHEAIAECVTDVLTTFWGPLWSITGQMHGNRESICFI